MAILAGPSAPIQSALVQMTRNASGEPFGLEASPSGLSPVELAILQIVKLIHRLMGIVETAYIPAPPVPEDDFMHGWGKDDLEAGM